MGAVSPTSAGRSPERSIALLIAGTGALLLALFWFPVCALSAPTGAPPLPLLVLLGTAVVAESSLLHLHFRGERHSFSLSETALVLGLFFWAPWQAVCVLIASTLLVGSVRRQAPLRLAFNTVATGLDASVAAVAFYALRGGAATATVRGWAAVLAAVAASLVVSAVLVTLVISLADGRGLRLTYLPSTLVPSLLGGLTSTSVAIAATVLLSIDGRAVLLLVVPGAVLFLSYRSYLRQQQEAQRIEFLLSCSRALSAPGRGDGPVAAELLQLVRERFATDAVALVLFGTEERSGTLVVAHESPGGGAGESRGLDAGAVDGPVAVLRQRPLNVAEVERLRSQVPCTTPAPVARLGVAGRTPLIGTRFGEQGLCALLPGDRDAVGLLLVGAPLATGGHSEADLLLVQALAQQAGAAFDNDQLHDLQHRLRHQADHDSLTGLPNRRAFTARLAAELARCPAVLFLDLDGFKSVNDTYGHAAGDQLLQRCAERLLEGLPPDAMGARLGGDEFAVVLPGPVPPGQSHAVAESLLASLSAPVPVGDALLPIRASVGLVLSSRPGESGPRTAADTVSELMKRADIAMYEAKRAGKGQVVVFRPEQQSAVRERFELERDLESAVLDGRLDVAFQPVVHLATGRLVGLEALARWTHPSRGPVSPDRFIPLAEANGLIGAVGRQVLRAAAHHLATWSRTGPAETPYLAVNLSTRQLDQPGLVRELLEVLRACGVHPDQVVVEVTESCLLSSADRAASQLTALRRAGVRVALDDFGTGYSSLHLLRTLPVDILKLDRTFVAGLVDSEQDQVVVRAILDLARGLRLLVVAEGVETRAQAELLSRLGCPYAQGYLFSRPVPGEQADAFVADARRREQFSRPALAVAGADLRVLQH